MSRKMKFNNNWYFAKQPLHTSLETVAAGGFPWTPVTIPHDWLIYDVHHLYENGDGWYRKSFTIPEQYKDEKMFLRFEGVYMNSTLYVNGQEAGTWKYGYSTFEFDITPHIKPGINEIYVQVIHEAPNSRWYSGAGIYRSVWLKSCPDTHLVSDGSYISTFKNGSSWSAQVETEVFCGENIDLLAEHKLRLSVLDAADTLIAQAESSVPAAAGSTVIVKTSIPIDKPNLWDIDQPYCYQLVAELIVSHVVTEEETTAFGFRTLEFDSGKGFYLNGRLVKLHGVCQHHDLGCLGAAVNKAALRRQITLLQEMGVNAIRTAHNMPAVELMELADEMGVLIVSEAFDMWERPKTQYDYARFYPEWWFKDVASWVRRDRNHPSMLMWSIGNEIYDTHADERGQHLTRELRDLVRLHDPHENAYVTLGSNYMPWKNAQNCADLVTVAGYNYAEKYYDLHHQEHPHWIIYGSETASTVQSRGIYHFPLSQSVLADDDEQCSSLGNSATSWGAKSTESCIIADRDAFYSPGMFIWTGFDYIGEPTPYHTKNSYFGQLDTAGFKKDSYYIYQAEWTDYRACPMVHIFPYWDFSEGQLIDVRVCSNAPKIELFFNDVSLGVHHIDHAHGQKLLGEWQLSYTKGVLRAVAYNEEDVPIATEIKSSFGDAATLVMNPDKHTIQADGSDLIFVEIFALDQQGRPVENATNRIQVSLEGPGRLVGLDNGDSTDYDSYKGSSRKLFSGKLLAVIASTLDNGPITVRATSIGLETAELTLTASPAILDHIEEEELPLYALAPTNNPEAHDHMRNGFSKEIPVRKLEIVCPEGNQLHKEAKSVPIRAVIYPEHATYQDVEWRITNAAGIDTNIATLQACGQEAIVTALGDGDVFVRCGTTNGSDRIKLYSLMQFHITGMGQAYLNPYEFVSAGYHNASSRNLTNGNERGVATGRDGESWICFDKIDFGSFGSDELTLPIFSLDNEEFMIHIWEGIPGKADSALLTQVTYQKPSIWNVYQEVSYRLPKRLTGITSLCFVLQRKIHLKGFWFTKLKKAYERLTALENNEIYGDSFTTKADAIENIGNNVSLIFKEMDFGQPGSAKLVICGCSPVDKNTIHILFRSSQGESKQLVEFPYSDGYVERSFTLELITGLQTVTFMFMPGSRFHLKWFQFESLQV